ncbi:MAG: glutamate-5-semialdehyde dehydrogenase [Clostridia bacterium]|nr:glutamate-5-semialdehyde dehydrogenase [Clostridia bacterium]
MNEKMIEMGKRAREASYVLAALTSAKKNEILHAVAAALKENAGAIAAANAEDIRIGRENGLSESLLDRLAFGESRVCACADAVLDVAALPDPVGRALWGSEHPNGMRITRVTVPLGVIGMIYEARPNVTIDAAALCVKSGNAVILRGGKEAINSNKASVAVMRGALESLGLPADCVQLIEDTSRQSSVDLMHLNGYIDVLIPRGGAGLIRAVVENASVPVIETGAGNCHVYIDETADVGMAADIVFNAKTSRPSVCNACESLLVHEKIAQKALPAIAARLAEKNVEIVGDETVCAILPEAASATEDDWGREYLDYKISVKTVSGVDEAIRHINKYSTHHSEAIVTESYENAEKFLNGVDSAAVYVNASTRFTDGGEFGFGAEIGISTQKLHARGPVGLESLVTTKYQIRGGGQVR